MKNIFKVGELEKEVVTEESSATGADGKNYKTKFYSLDAIISVGYRINSMRVTQFRQWATKVLHTYTIQGYVLDKKRLENGQIFDEEYFEHLLDEIREIRASERSEDNIEPRNLVVRASDSGVLLECYAIFKNRNYFKQLCNCEFEGGVSYAGLFCDYCISFIDFLCFASSLADEKIWNPGISFWQN